MYQSVQIRENIYEFWHAGSKNVFLFKIVLNKWQIYDDESTD